jgi:transcription initiation factor TFIIB
MSNMAENTMSLQGGVEKSRSFEKTIKFYLDSALPAMEERFPIVDVRDLHAPLSCPACSTENVFHDTNRGDIICMNCGGIVEQHSVDARGVRVYDQEDVESKVHYEPMKPENRLMLKLNSRDPDSRRRERENNRILWDQKKVMIMSIELSKLKSVLPISKRLHDATMEEVKKVFATDILRGRNAVLVGLAVMYYSAIKTNSPIGLNDIIKSVSRGKEEEKKARRAIRSAIQVLSKRLGYKFVPKNDHADLMSKVSSELEIPQPIVTGAIKMFKYFKSANVLSGDPKGYVGACLYCSCKMHTGIDDTHTQKKIAKAIEMTDVTVRKRAKEVFTFFETHGVPS